MGGRGIPRDGTEETNLDIVNFDRVKAGVDVLPMSSRFVCWDLELPNPPCEFRFFRPKVDES